MQRQIKDVSRPLLIQRSSKGLQILYPLSPQNRSELGGTFGKHASQGAGGRAGTGPKWAQILSKFVHFRQVKRDERGSKRNLTSRFIKAPVQRRERRWDRVPTPSTSCCRNSVQRRGLVWKKFAFLFRTSWGGKKKKHVFLEFWNR